MIFITALEPEKGPCIGASIAPLAPIFSRNSFADCTSQYRGVRTPIAARIDIPSSSVSASLCSLWARAIIRLTSSRSTFAERFRL